MDHKLTRPQTSFVALNLEPEEGSDEEIDDTKEIQARDIRPIVNWEC